MITEDLNFVFGKIYFHTIENTANNSPVISEL